MRNLKIGQSINSRQCSEITDGVTPKVKAEGGYRFYVLFDKIGREGDRFTGGCPGLRTVLADGIVTKPPVLGWFHIATRC